MRHLQLDEVLELHRRILAQSGGADGLRDRGALESALAQPQMAFGGRDLYPDLAGKAAALGHALVANHPFVDGSKRIAHAATEVLLLLNGFELDATVDQAERLMLDLAAGLLGRDELSSWLRAHIRPSSE